MINKNFLKSPATGKLLDIRSIEDPVFSSGIMVEGVAILSEKNQITSPISGIVTVINPSKHAYRIVGDDGVEVLIHIGIETVSLNGEGFESNIKINQRIKSVEVLAKIDLDFLNSKGSDPFLTL
ncbi:PTS glucose transporter subunit IIA [Enterococcus faecium]|nr:PTS glucose transporter subunit IIA [Enterococcus faecium]